VTSLGRIEPLRCATRIALNIPEASSFPTPHPKKHDAGKPVLPIKPFILNYIRKTTRNGSVNRNGRFSAIFGLYFTFLGRMGQGTQMFEDENLLVETAFYRIAKEQEPMERGNRPVARKLKA
jgi:hypothetical protein